MKGVVFTELLAMAEETFGEDLVDRVIEQADLPSGGAYTAIGTYPCEELFALVGGFSAHSGIPGAELQRLFGHWLFKAFRRSYPQFFADRSGSLDVLEVIEGEIHKEVRKLYPDAELPTFDTWREMPDALKMDYRSHRPLADLCQGLIEACCDEFNETAYIERTNLSNGPVTRATFRISIQTAE